MKQIDKWLYKNETFWNNLQIHCVPECCGLDAFCFEETTIKKVIKTPVLENEVVNSSKPSSMVKTYLFTKTKATITMIIGSAAFFKLRPIKE